MKPGEFGMSRQDEDLPFLLKYENVARYDNGTVQILDRRKYPSSIEFVTCGSYIEVAQAIADMVTQSGGPWLAASWAMVATARTVRGMQPHQGFSVLDKAAEVLAAARPTTSKKLLRHLRRIRDVTVAAMERGDDPEQASEAVVWQALEERYARSRQIGELAANLLPTKVTVLTHCFAETLLAYMLLAARAAGKEIDLVCAETRPYLQGARLTASVARDMGFRVTVITDAMAAHLLASGLAQAFVSAADVITLDGHVVNKIGTLSIALACQAYGVPYYVLGDPSPDHPTVDTVTIEMRDGSEVLACAGIRTSPEGVHGWYPAFDITPPRLISLVVTSGGVMAPQEIKKYSAHWAQTPKL